MNNLIPNIPNSKVRYIKNIITLPKSGNTFNRDETNRRIPFMELIDRKGLKILTVLIADKLIPSAKDNILLITTAKSIMF